MAHFSRQLLHPVVLPLLLASCARGEVDLGQGTTAVAAPRGARCLNSTVIDGALVVHDQDELAALAGCEEIHGDLYVRTFQGADLTPLSALRRVEGALRLGEGPRPATAEEQQQEPSDALRWLTSLAGLESLESVGSLMLSYTSVPDLRPLSHLRSLDSDHTQAPLAGQLMLVDTRGLRDFTGLERVAGLRFLNLYDNPDLESLDGLNVPPRLDGVFLEGNPTLSQIDALAALEFVDTFTLDRTSVANLDALSGLNAQSMQLFQNSKLVDASGLNVGITTKLIIGGNPLLKALPDLSNGVVLTGPNLDVEILDNDALESVTLPASWNGGLDDLESEPYGRVSRIDISGNQALVSIRSPVGFVAATSFSVLQNDSLTEIDLSSFKTFTNLTIDQNPALRKVDVPALQTVDTLVVTNNPRLSSAAFGAVRTFASTMNGNADDALMP